MRYRFYREHKYVSSALNDLERQIAQTDFANVDEVARIKEAFESLSAMLIMHANYEEERIHRLLSAKDSSVHAHAETDHRDQQAQINAIAQLIQEVLRASGDDDKIEIGHQVYLTYRKFVADNLLHLHEEETVILAELQRLYSDDELRSVAAIAYREMSPDDMMHMVQGLFPHMNKYDRYAFLANMRILEHAKFVDAWPSIRTLLPPEEQTDFDVV